MHGLFRRHRQVVRRCRSFASGGDNLGGLPGATPKSTSEKMLESWESFMQPETRPVMLDRWDWHHWQLFTALLPGFAVLGLAAWADHDMDQKSALIIAEREMEANAAKAALQKEIEENGQSEKAQVEARLEALEQTLQGLVERLSAQELKVDNARPVSKRSATTISEAR